MTNRSFIGHCAGGAVAESVLLALLWGLWAVGRWVASVRFAAAARARAALEQRKHDGGAELARSIRFKVWDLSVTGINIFLHRAKPMMNDTC